MQATKTKDRLKHNNHDLIRDLTIKLSSRVIALFSKREVHLNFIPDSRLPIPDSLLPTQLDT
ncbi:hypothetical protein [Moorena sp. SIO3A2]|uniref:hypothetical protein n=1 Tax=Moorena sp. SIO3A2 TaxID=2607841 RepID=UPI0013B6CAB5|nr:hypothetical protein [Moorena sp. SIO3A2]NER86812.1 hypothetical protein [Moorena sp. SIO3A2]